MSRQYVEIELDGKTRLLRFDFNAVAELEEKLGKGIAAVMSEQQIGFNLTRTLYWAGLKWKDRGLTIERAGQLLQKEVETSGKSIGDLIMPAVKALMQSGLLGDTEIEELDQLEGKSEDEDPNDELA